MPFYQDEPQDEPERAADGVSDGQSLLLLAALLADEPSPRPLSHTLM